MIVSVFGTQNEKHKSYIFEMRHIISFCLTLFFCLDALGQEVCLVTSNALETVSTCEAFLPEFMYSHSFIYQSDIERFSKNGDYGQLKDPNSSKHYWKVYNIYNNAAAFTEPDCNSQIHSRIKFNTELRIAKIRNDYALVYEEPKKQFASYPQISNDAYFYGWISMDSLLLYVSCPVNDFGVYPKAFLKKNRSKHFFEASDVYYIMKTSEDKYLLSKLHTLEGLTDQLLYGWVDSDSVILWNNNLCIEPNWQNANSEKDILLLGQNNNVWRYSLHQHRNEEEPAGSSSEYRISKDKLPFPVVEENTFSYTVLYPEEESGEILWGITPKHNNKGLQYWQPSVFISADQFNQCMQRLEPINRLIRQNSDRKDIILAIKNLLRFMYPDMTEKQLDSYKLNDCFSPLFTGVIPNNDNDPSQILSDLIEPAIVSHSEFFDIISEFSQKYRNLLNFKTKGYRYSVNVNNVNYYRIPLMDLP